MKESISVREFQVIIEKDDDGYLIANVPGLKGCHTQAKSIDTLMIRIKEAIELCLEVTPNIKSYSIGAMRTIVL